MRALLTLLFVLAGCGGSDEPATWPENGAASADGEAPAELPAAASPPGSETAAVEPPPPAESSGAESPAPAAPGTAPPADTGPPSLDEQLAMMERAREEARGLRRRPPGSLRSRSLRAIAAAVRREVAAARRAVPSDLPGDTTSHTFRVVAYRLDGAELEWETRAMIFAYLRPDPQDFVFYMEVAAHPAPLMTEDARGDLDLPGGATAPEQEAVRLLAERIAAEAPAHPSLRIFRAWGGWGDAVGGEYHGPAFIDTETGEALWILRARTWNAG
jgi:hypothetical protein